MPDTLTARIEFLRLRDLLLLERIDAASSLRQVAQGLHLTQPAVTQALQSLEQAFGATLVARSPQGVTLTDAGRAAMKRMRVARLELLGARDAAQAPARRELRIGTLPAVALELLPRWLAQLHRDHPQVRISLTEVAGPSAWAQLEEGALDLIMARPPQPELRERQHTGLRYQVVGHSDTSIVAPCQHPLAQGLPTVATLAAAEWVLPPAASLTARMLCDWFATQGVAAPQPVVVCDSVHTNLLLAAEGGLLTLAPTGALRRYGAALGLTAIDLPWPGRRAAIVAAYRASAADDPLIQALLGGALAQGPGQAPAAGPGDKNGLSPESNW